MDTTRETLLVRLKDGADQTAWRTFDQLYRPMLIGYARARGLDINDAEDVAQQCVQVVLGKIGEYEHLGSFKTWLRAIAEKKICDKFRARGREVQATTTMWDGHADSQPGPEDLWESHWWEGHLRHCAEVVRSQVAESTFAAFVGYALDGEPVATVAERLGLTANQVYVAKHRVLDRIRELMIELTGADLCEGRL